MYFNRGLINGREAIAFWPDKRAAGYLPNRHPAGLPDFVLPTQTRPGDGMTVADVGGLTPLLRWEGSFSNADAFLETAARCEAQGWCLALTLDTVFVRKDGTLCLIALPFEDESQGDIDTLRAYLANPAGFGAFRKYDNVEAYLTPHDRRTDAPDYSFFGISGPVGGTGKKAEPEPPSDDFFGMGNGGKPSPDEDAPDADFASIMGGEAPEPVRESVPEAPDDFTSAFGGGASEPGGAAQPEAVDAFTAAFSGTMPAADAPAKAVETPAEKPSETVTDVFSGLFGGDLPGMEAPAKTPEPEVPEHNTPKVEAPAEPQDKRGIVDAFQKFAKAFEVYIGGEEAAQGEAPEEPSAKPEVKPETVAPAGEDGGFSGMFSDEIPVPAETVIVPAVEPEKQPEPVEDDSFPGMFTAFEEVEIPAPAEPVTEPAVEPEKQPEPVEDDSFPGMFTAFEEVEIPVAAEPVVEPSVEPEKQPEPVEDDSFPGMFSAFEEVEIPAPAEPVVDPAVEPEKRPEPVEDDSFSGMFSAFEEVEIPAPAEPAVEPEKQPEPAPIPEPSDGEGDAATEESFSDVMSFFEDLLGLGAEDEET